MNQAQTPAISLEGVRKSRGNFELGPVDLSIEPGYVVAVVGLNGGGKSTLFGMLMNLLQPDSGEIKLFGSSYPRDEVEMLPRSWSPGGLAMKSSSDVENPVHTFPTLVPFLIASR
ncbi:hypothetical protein BH18ACT11_BH18ACT11_11390 [soil metagenome]